MTMQNLTETQLNSICAVLANTNNGLTKSELVKCLSECKIPIIDDNSKTINNGFAYRLGLNKRDWLYNCLCEEINNSHSFCCVYTFIECAMSPIRYTSNGKRSQFEWLYEEINKVLLLLGISLNFNGKLIKTLPAETLEEVDRRVNNLKKKLYDRSIHSEVTKYCIKDYLRKDYFDAVFEAAKGLAERVREMTGLTTDGTELFNTAFSTKLPYLTFNKLTTQSETSEYNGLKELLCAIFHLVRNPEAHTPKINWKVDETKALDILTLISFAHKYLDECYQIPKN